MKYYPASTRTVFVDPTFPGWSIRDRDTAFSFRPSLDGLFQQASAIDTPFTATEPIEMHVTRAQP